MNIQSWREMRINTSLITCCGVNETN